jgi:hypothetical protein
MTTKTKTLADHPHIDQRGLDWQAAASKVWEDSGHDLNVWEDAPERQLPDFAADAPEHVTREVLGGYITDGTTVHRIATAEPECGVDAISPALFIHHWHEVVEQQPELKPCPHCLPLP